jgi:hypothetical protein
MGVVQLRREAMRRLRELPARKVAVAHDFLGYLESQAGGAATRELLRIPGLLEDLRQARRDQAAGMFTPHDKLRRKYKRHV